jgi:PncC family amidohydrolase
MTTDAMLIGQLLLERNQILATAESCTGGLLASRITAITGASKWFAGGWVTYSNQMKTTQLGIDARMIKTHGAVSWQVAEAMCEMAATKSGASVALSTTGIAGPSGGTEEKPVGTVFIGCAVDGQTQVREFRFQGDRETVQETTVTISLQMARLCLLDEVIKHLDCQHGATFA